MDKEYAKKLVQEYQKTLARSEEAFCDMKILLSDLEAVQSVGNQAGLEIELLERIRCARSVYENEKNGVEIAGRVALKAVIESGLAD